MVVDRDWEKLHTNVCSMLVPSERVPSHWRYRCPYCGSVTIYKFTRYRSGYRCKSCGQLFTEPVDMKEEVR